VTVRLERAKSAAREQPVFTILHAGRSLMSPEVETWLVSADEYQLFVNDRGFFSQPGETAPGSSVLACMFQMLGTAHVEFRLGVDVDVLLKFEAPARINFKFSGQVARHRNASVSFFGRGNPISMYPATDPKPGGFQLGPQVMQPGTYRMEVSLTEARTYPCIVRDVELKPGDNTLEIDLPELHALRIDASAHKERYGLRIEQRSSGKAGFLSPDKDGMVVVPGLPPGQYRLTLPAGGGEAAEIVVNIQVPTGGTVVIPG
jgi:hypothetical protein